MGYEYDAAEAARYAEFHPDARYVLAEDYDRLAAENAELRKSVAEMQQACEEFSDELAGMHKLELEAKCHGDLEESHKILVDVVAERDATLDRLREVVPPCLWLEVSQLAFGHLCTVQDILYPAPETTDEDK